MTSVLRCYKVAKITPLGICWRYPREGFSSQMKIAMLAPPWLPIPPIGYGGIENVLAVLVPALMELGAEVELFTIGDTTIKATKNHSLYRAGQYEYIHRPAYESLPIYAAQTMFALNKVLAAGDFDIIHSHNFIPDMLAAAYADGLPPVVHTLHNPPFTTPDRLAMDIPDNTPMWRQVAQSQRLTEQKNLFIVCISHALADKAPRALRPVMLKPVHNGVDPAQFPFVSHKSDYFVTLARSHPDKGQGIAARLCSQLGYKLKLAGIVGSMNRPRQVILELANPSSRFRSLIDFRYFSDEIFPYLEEGEIEYVGDLSGQNKMDFLSHARALLFPIQWEEPFGMAPIEALACGTPVIAMARGALPEIIQHGTNGFLAHTEKEFAQYMKRVGEIDPAACRKSVEDKFSATCMAKQYLDRFETVLRKQAKRRMAQAKPKRNRKATGTRS